MADPAQETWRGRHVEFLIRDIHLPQPAEVLLELHGDEALAGEVIDLSGNTQEGGAFVVVRCERLRRPCVLALEHIQAVDE